MRIRKIRLFQNKKKKKINKNSNITYERFESKKLNNRINFYMFKEKKIERNADLQLLQLNQLT